ncbi:MAG: hypothetical protein FJ254_10145 [Phycisphaerae bacterium]|nr:hypothetical protein [Phycisphaerae bacterium]
MIDRNLTMAARPERLVRLGRPGDGGYVVPCDLLPSCDGVIGLGVRDDWSFEDAAAACMSCCHGVHLYDPTTTLAWLVRRSIGVVPKTVAHAIVFDRVRLSEDVQRLVAPGRYLMFPMRSTRHFREWAGGATGTPLTTIIDRMRGQGAERILLKFDIEGGEYQLLGDVPSWALHVAMVVAEFHDLEPDPSAFHALLSQLNQCFTPVHISANAGAGLLPCGFPRVPEITFVRTDLLPKGARRATQTYPIPGLDQGNGRGQAPLAFEA